MEPSLHRHLVENEVAPELHLTRWLRCMMSREFCLETTLNMWDFIFSGISYSMVTDLLSIPEDTIDYENLLKEPSQDPFINLECLSVAMVALIKADLLESDFSMCLGLLMSYKEPENPKTILDHAKRVRRNLVNKEAYERLPSPDMASYNVVNTEEAKSSITS